MLGLPLAFAAPAVLAALAGLVALYFLLRVTPPSPRRTLFPPLRLLIGLDPKETTPARTPWPILALRLAIGATIIFAMAGPLWNSVAALFGSGPLLVVVDDGWPAAPTWDKRLDFVRERIDAAARSGRIVAIHPMSQGGRDIAPLDSADARRPAALADAGSLRAGPRGRAAGDRALPRPEPKTEVLWVADGVELGGAGGFAATLASAARSVEVVTSGTGARALAGVDNEAGALSVRITRSDERAPATGARPGARRPGARNRTRGDLTSPANSRTDAGFDLPVELRNDVAAGRHRRRTLGRRDLARRRALAPATRRHRLGRERRRRAAAARAELLSQARAAARSPTSANGAIRRPIRSSRSWPKSPRSWRSPT